MIANHLNKRYCFRNFPPCAFPKVLIIYDDIALGTLTRHFLMRLSKSARCDLQIWHCFAPLIDMDSVQEIIRRRVESVDMIFIALSPREEAVENVKCLMRSWSQCASLGDKALVALGDNDPEHEAWCIALKMACEQFLISLTYCQFHET